MTDSATANLDSLSEQPKNADNENLYVAMSPTSSVSSESQSKQSAKSPPALPAKSKGKSLSPPLPEKKVIGRSDSTSSSRSSSRTSSPHPGLANQTPLDSDQCASAPVDTVPRTKPPQIPLRKNEKGTPNTNSASATTNAFQLTIGKEPDELYETMHSSDGYDNKTTSKTSSVLSDRTLVNSAASDDVYDVAQDVVLTPVTEQLPLPHALNQSQTQNQAGAQQPSLKIQPTIQEEAIYNNEPDGGEAVYDNAWEEPGHTSATLKGKSSHNISASN